MIYLSPFWKYKSIVDINECMEGGARCHKDAGCLNNKGSYNCICSGEFYGDGKNCRGWYK
ncbi:hypothetical protein LOTGIDRAFT_145864 [Lottia gigantea]|uniref:EGF-like domain-containing protein n=1 Tax=Lottia gigantea TaxID=225164 RepID=V4A0R9_LOTGI|nr:hypothetical protein LOTGIDRAFT_145864 [Lottia gigantea]ESO88520.1 hypothetical protein LOTGIDRAFT_145864 [Lottia gigantea]